MLCIQTTKHINKPMTIYIVRVYSKYLVTCVYTWLLTDWSVSNFISLIIVMSQP